MFPWPSVQWCLRFYCGVLVSTDRPTFIIFTVCTQLTHKHIHHIVTKLSTNLQILLPLRWHHGGLGNRSRCLAGRDTCQDLCPECGWCSSGRILSDGPEGEAGNRAAPCWWRPGRRWACSSCRWQSAAWWRCETERWSPLLYLFENRRRDDGESEPEQEKQNWERKEDERDSRDVGVSVLTLSSHHSLCVPLGQHPHVTIETGLLHWGRMRSWLSVPNSQHCNNAIY